MLEVDNLSQDYYCKLRYSLTEAFDRMEDSEVASIVRRMLHFMQDLDLPALTETATAVMIWSVAEADLKKDKADRENGRKGGRPSANTQKTHDRQTASKPEEDPHWLC